MTAATAMPARQKFNAHVQFTKDAGATKAAGDGAISIKGYASTWIKDRDGEYVAPDAFDGSWDAFIGKNPMMLYQHNPDWPIGSFEDGLIDEHGLFVAGNCPKPQAGEVPEVVTAYHKIDAGVLCTFSIGGFMYKVIDDGAPVISKVELMEISVVSIPANQDSIFQVAKALAEGRPAGQLAPKAIAQMEQLMGFRPLSDPDLLTMDAAQVAAQWDALSELFEEVNGAAPPPRDAWLKVLRARNGGVDLPIVARAAHTVVSSFYHPEAAALDAGEVKVGRTLSATNEAKLRKAKSHIDEVLTSAAPTDTPATAGPAGDDADTWNDGDPVDSPTNPATHAPPFDPERMAVERGLDRKTYQDLQAALTAAIVDQLPVDEADDGWVYCYVQDFSDEWAVYYHAGQLWQVPYTRDVDGNINLGTPVEVRPVTTYVELSAGERTERKRAVDRARGGEPAPEPKGTGVQIDAEGRAFIDLGRKGALPVRDLPLAPRGQAWDADAARDRVKEWSGGGDAPSDKYGQAFLWRDDDGSTYTEYRFIVADVIDGTLKYVPKGIFAAANVVQGGRGGTAGDIADAIKPKLDALYGKVAKEFDDDTIKPPWADEEDTSS